MYRINTPTNGPSFDFGQLVVSGMLGGDTAAQIAFSHDGAQVEFRCGAALTTTPIWSDWVSLSTATPPEEYDLPLADGITALQPCTYYKNQFSEVTLGGCTSGSVSDGATIATLPEGFRPDHPIERPATFTASGNRYAGSVFIAANGIVSIRTPAEATNVVFAASFLAKN